MSALHQDTVPVRACCGHRHTGPVCPDGTVMCCVCLDRFTRDELAPSPEDPNVREDICLTCAWHDGPAQTITWMLHHLNR